jgi:proline racemase
MWVDDPSDPRVDGRNMPVNSGGGFDRSPCGTGTSARLAVLHPGGKLTVGQEYVNSSVLGTVYRARITGLVKVGEVPAVIPEITGRAWITGRSELWSDPTDPLAAGFLLQ